MTLTTPSTSEVILRPCRSSFWNPSGVGVAVTASVQLVGVYLVFSSLIIPALATRAYLGKRRLAMGYALGALGYGIGLGLSAILDLPSGAVIVWALAACAMGFVGIRSTAVTAVGTAQPARRSS